MLLITRPDRASLAETADALVWLQDSRGIKRARITVVINRGVGRSPPDPTRWAPRLSPWNGAPRTGEDPAVVAERLKRERNDRSPESGKHDSRRDDPSDLLGRMIERRRAIAEQDPKTTPS